MPWRVRWFDSGLGHVPDDADRRLDSRSREE
jgi:hypothetical protein